MATRTIVQPGTFTAADIAALMCDPAAASDGLASAAADGVPGLLGIGQAPAHLFHEMDWHIREAGYICRDKWRPLAWPVVGAWIRDQHEVNRLLLVGIEMAMDRLDEVEREAARFFSRYRTSERANWVKRFRHLGLKWKVARAAAARLRAGWQRGRRPGWPKRSRAGQQDLNALMEECLVALAEIAAALVEALDGVEGSAADIGQNLAACLWHAREGGALRGAPRGRPWHDQQAALYRLYRITLEQLSILLKDLQVRVHHLPAGQDILFRY